MYRLVIPVLALVGLLSNVAVLSGQETAARPRASLGVTVESAPADAPHPGLIVRDILPQSPAAKAGMKSGDVIVKIENQEVKEFDDLANTLSQHKPGDKLTFHVLRDGKDEALNVTLGERPERRARRPQEFRFGRPTAFLGVQTVELTPDLRANLGVSVNAGAVVTDVLPETPAGRAGLKQNDVITRLDDKDIAGRSDLLQAVQSAGVGKEVSLKVARGKETKELKAKLEETPGDIGVFRRRLEVPPFPGEGGRIEKLERRLDELEKRLRDLEQKQPKLSK